MTATSERLQIPGPAGVLEALLELPPAQPATPAGIGVVCHPHPLHGGTLDNKIAFTLARTLNLLGLASLRFNFRGVGESDGTFDDGQGERDDVLAAVRYARTRMATGPLWLAGFSFGACMAVRAAAAAEAARLVLVAPAVDRYGLDEALVTAPVVLVQGMDDDVVDADAAVRWGRSLPVAVDIIEFDVAGHYFHGKQVALRTRLQQSLQRAMEQ